MANDLTITETATWPATVKLIDIDEAVIGGVDGVSNAQAIALAARSLWLKTQVANVIAGGGISADDADLTQLYDAIQALIAAQNLAGLSDVTLTAPQTGETLVYNGAAWVNSVPANVLGELRKVLLLNGLRDAITDGSAARLVNSFPDPYVDLSGINTGASSGYLLDATGAFIHNPVQVQVGQGVGTPIGNMTIGGGLVAAYDGVTAQIQSAGAKTSGTDGTGWIGKDWGGGTSRIITGVEFWGSSDAGVEYSGGGTNFVWKLKGSNAAPSYGGGTTLYTSGTVADSNGVYVDNLAIAAGAAYQNHWIEIDSDGAGWITLAEVRFHEQATAGDLVLVSQPLVPLAVPTNGHFIGLVEPIDAIALNTDLKLFMSRDGGVIWDELTLEQLSTTVIDVNGTPTTVDVVFAEGALTGASETNGLYKWESYNTKELRLHGAAPEFS